MSAVGVISTPEAWMPGLRHSPSRMSAFRISMSCLGDSLRTSARPGASLSALRSVMPISSGTSLLMRSASGKLKPSTRETSLMTPRAAMVPKVMICETLSRPYFWATKQKSMSMSGMEMRSGLRKRSKIRPLAIGSMSVICMQ